MFKIVNMATQQTSKAFIARLPEMTDEQCARVVEWAKETCVKSDLVMDKEGALQLIAIRAREKSARQLMGLLKTNFKNWNITSVKQSGWLKLIEENRYEEFRAPGMAPDTEQEEPRIEGLRPEPSCSDGAEHPEANASSPPRWGSSPEGWKKRCAPLHGRAYQKPSGPSNSPGACGCTDRAGDGLAPPAESTRNNERVCPDRRSILAGAEPTSTAPPGPPHRPTGFLTSCAVTILDDSRRNAGKPLGRPPGSRWERRERRRGAPAS